MFTRNILLKINITEKKSVPLASSVLRIITPKCYTQIESCSQIHVEKDFFFSNLLVRVL